MTPKIAAPIFQRLGETAGLFSSIVGPQDRSWDGIRQQLLEIVRIICRRDALTSRIKTEAVTYAVGLRTGLAAVQNFECRDFTEEEQILIANELTFTQTHETLECVANDVERDKLFVAYEKLDQLLSAALERAAA